MKKLLMLLMLGIFLFGVVNAESIGFVKIGVPFEITNYCQNGNCTQANLTSLTYPNKTVVYYNAEMTQNNSNFNYTYTPTEWGVYNFKTCADPSGVIFCDSDTFTANGTGFELTNSTTFIYLAILTLLVLLFLLNAVGISKIPGGNPRADSGSILSISKLKYLKPTLIVLGYGLFISILFLASSIASAYLGDQAFSNFTFKLFSLFSNWKAIVLAMFLYVIWIIISVFKDIKIQQFFERGFSPV